jgi:hypothetical protein
MLKQLVGLHAHVQIESSKPEALRVVALGRFAMALIVMGSMCSHAGAAGISDGLNRAGSLTQSFLNFGMYLFYAAGVGTFAAGIFGLVKLAKKDHEAKGVVVAAQLVCGCLLGAVGWLCDNALQELTGQSSSSAQQHAGFQS